MEEERGRCELWKLNRDELWCQTHSSVFPLSAEALRLHSKNKGKGLLKQKSLVII